jgi:hypothetical protein
VPTRRDDQLTREIEEAGLLRRLARTLDYPGRKIREAITGEEEASGRRVLERIGLLEPNRPGFDLGDVAGFATEVATDPLSYVTGIGTLTKGGKAAAAAGKSKGALEAAEAALRLETEAAKRAGLADEVLELTERLARTESQAKRLGVPTALAPTAREQVEAGQRALLSVAGQPVIRGAPVIGALARGGQALAGSRFGTGARKLFDPRYGKSEALEPLAERFAGREVREGEIAGREIAESLGKDIDEAVAGGTREEAASRLFREAETLGSAAPFTLKTQDILSKQLAREQAAGIPVKALSAETKSYIPRTVLSKDAIRWLSDPKNERTVRSYLARKYSTKQGFQERRLPELLEEYTGDLNKLFEERLGAGKKWFVEDPAVQIGARVASGEKAVAMAKLFQAAAQKFGEPMREGLVPAEELLSRAALTPEVATRFAGKGIPPEIADELLGMADRITSPEAIQGLTQVLDKTLALYRGALTVPFPAYHVRNVVSDTMLSWLGTSTGAMLKTIGPAFRLAVQALKNPSVLAFYEALGILRGSGARFIQGELPALARRLPKAGKAGRAYATFSENFTRVWHFLAKKAEGLSDVEAAASVKKNLFDYSDLTGAEKILAKRIFLFYPWTRKVIPKVMTEYFENPGKMAALTRATVPGPGAEGPIPEQVKRTAAIPIWAGPQGEEQFLTGFGSPLEELSKFDPTGGAGGVLGGGAEILKRIGQQVAPVWRAPAEAALGKDLFTGRDILDMDRAEPILGKIPGLREAIGFREKTLPSGQKRFEADPLALFILRNLPTSRLQRTANQVSDIVADTDPRRGNLQNLLQLLSGVRVVSQDEVDKLRTLAENLRREAEPLRRTGEVRIFERPYAPKDEAGLKSPRATELLKLLTAVERQLKRAKEQ